MTHVNVYSKTHLHTKGKRTQIRLFTLTTKYVVELGTLLDGLRKGSSEVVKCKGSRHTLRVKVVVNNNREKLTYIYMNCKINIIYMYYLLNGKIDKNSDNKSP